MCFLLYLQIESQRYSFGKLLEMYFYGTDYVSQICQHASMRNHTRYFGKNDTIVEFEIEPIIVREIQLPSMKLSWASQSADPSDINLEAAARLIFDFVLYRLNELEQTNLTSKDSVQDQVNIWQKTKTKFYSEISQGNSVLSLAACLYNYAVSVHSFLFQVYQKYCKKHKFKSHHNRGNSVVSPAYSLGNSHSNDHLDQLHNSSTSFKDSRGLLKDSGQRDSGHLVHSRSPNLELLCSTSPIHPYNEPIHTQSHTNQSTETSSQKELRQETSSQHLHFSVSQPVDLETQSVNSLKDRNARLDEGRSMTQVRPRIRSSSQSENLAPFLRHQRNLSHGPFTPFTENATSHSDPLDTAGSCIWRYRDDSGNNWHRFGENLEVLLEGAWAKRHDTPQFVHAEGNQVFDFGTMTHTFKSGGITSCRKINRMSVSVPLEHISYSKHSPHEDNQKQVPSVPNQAILFNENPNAFFRTLYSGIGMLTPLKEQTKLVPSSSDRITVIHEDELGSFVAYLLSSSLYKEKSRAFDQVFQSQEQRPESWLTFKTPSDITASTHFNFLHLAFFYQFTTRLLQYLMTRTSSRFL